MSDEDPTIKKEGKQEAESEIEPEDIYARLDYYLSTYGTDKSLLCASEVDGYFTSIACHKDSLEPQAWVAAIWGTEEDQPQWESEEEEEEFLSLTLLMYLTTMQHLEQGEIHPVYMESEFNGQTELIIEEWCVGFMRGAHITGLIHSGDKDFLDEVLTPVRLFGTEKGWQKQESMSIEEIEFWQDLIEPSIMRLALSNHPNIQRLSLEQAHVIH